MDRLWEIFERQCVEHMHTMGFAAQADWPEFGLRMRSEFRRLAELLWDLYHGRPDFATQVALIIEDAFKAYTRRTPTLRERDRLYPPESGWFAAQDQVGAVAYVDRYAGTFKNLESRIPSLRELGVTYLHLMPFFLSPAQENDGGYAVSSYRDTNTVYGSMDDLERLAATLASEGIALVADFVFNHTSDEHEWALKAKSGDPDYREFYWTFADRAETVVYQEHLRDIFPEVRTGSFTWCEEMGRWVWTTFHPYQWDLDYSNPAVFRAMAGEMLGLANRGVSILRLDAVAFIWKRAGTSCENLSEAHTIIQAFQSIARLVCPSLLFLSEAIVHPDDIARYIDRRECQLSYNPLLMAELWEASATKDVSLLAFSLRKRHRLPAGCAWVNYVRCHDDIGWTFADEDAAAIGIKGGDHRAFLNDFYLGTFPGSFSRGVSFQYNPKTGDRRICGTAASLAGIERAVAEGLGQDLDTAIRRVLLLYGVAFAVGGIPLLYLGDELGMTNDYSYLDDPALARDSRWVHRHRWNDALYSNRLDEATVAGRVYAGIRRLSAARKAEPAFGTQAISVPESGHRSVLAFHKQAEGRLVTILGNFADEPATIHADAGSALLAGRSGLDVLTGRLVLPGEPVTLEPCELLWLRSEVE
ncbi:MAG: amylosucrase [Spirochaetales bacterium]|nr:amylosucrase [Spirochaetales bacterium]